MYGCHYPKGISIHTLHTEGDPTWISPAGRYGVISIHTLHTEGDRRQWNQYYNVVAISIHTLHTEGDRPKLSFFASLFDFNPHPPCGG